MKTECTAVGQDRFELPLARQDGPVATVAMETKAKAFPRRARLGTRQKARRQLLRDPL